MCMTYYIKVVFSGVCTNSFLAMTISPRENTICALPTQFPKHLVASGILRTNLFSLRCRNILARKSPILPNSHPNSLLALRLPTHRAPITLLQYPPYSLIPFPSTLTPIHPPSHPPFAPSLANPYLPRPLPIRNPSPCPSHNTLRDTPSFTRKHHTEDEGREYRPKTSKVCTSYLIQYPPLFPSLLAGDPVSSLSSHNSGSNPKSNARPRHQYISTVIP